MGLFSRRKKEASSPIISSPDPTDPPTKPKPHDRFIYEPKYARRDALSCMPAGNSKEDIDAVKAATAMRLSRSVSDFSTMSSNPKLARNSHSFSTLDYRSYAHSTNGSRPGSLYGMSGLGRSTMNAPPVPGIPLAYSTDSTPGPATPSNLTRENSTNNMLTILDESNAQANFAETSPQSSDLHRAASPKYVVAATYLPSASKNELQTHAFPRDTIQPVPARVWSGSEASDMNADGIEMVPRPAQARRIHSRPMSSMPAASYAFARPSADIVTGHARERGNSSYVIIDAPRSYPNDLRTLPQDGRSPSMPPLAFASAGTYPETSAAALTQSTTVAVPSINDPPAVASTLKTQDSRSPIQSHAFATDTTPPSLQSPCVDTALASFHEQTSVRDAQSHASLPGAFPHSPYCVAPRDESEAYGVDAHRGSTPDSSDRPDAAYSYQLQQPDDSHAGSPRDPVNGYFQYQHAWTPVGLGTHSQQDARDPRIISTAQYPTALRDSSDQSRTNLVPNAKMSMTPEPLQIASATSTLGPERSNALDAGEIPTVPTATAAPPAVVKKSRLGFLRRSSVVPAAQSVPV